ncbi:MAG: DNA polymerase I, partial [Bacteroidales bacterium]|nr:DNA polymerase I [Bacteroidales bacterium]
AAEETEEQKKERKKKSAALCALMPIVRDELEKKLSGDRVYKEIEMPLISVLAQVEMAGVKIDTRQLKEYSKELTAQMNEIEQEARKLADDASINLSSPKQIGILLYEKLKLNPNVKKSVKGNYSTDETTLNELKDTHPIVEKILEYRNLKKLLSTYIDALPLLINPKTGKVHTTFNQALTSTGRLSSINPNLQNIPVRTERGREIRKAFVPSDPAGCIVSADYSQIELRLMAHMSGDENLIAAFNSGKDVHAATAAKLYNVSVDEVTAEQRRKAKTVNFGIIYGISAFGLAERMEIPIKEAKEFIETYFKTYPGVSRYINAIAETARKKEYVETIYGRRRYLKDINSRNANVRKFNERNAVNAPLQGSAADIIKLAMIHVFARIQAEHLKSKMVLQVHDELVFDVVPSEREAIMKIAKEEMENVIKLKVPLTADCSYGENWLQAH